MATPFLAEGVQRNISNTFHLQEEMERIFKMWKAKPFNKKRMELPCII